MSNGTRSPHFSPLRHGAGRRPCNRVLGADAAGIARAADLFRDVHSGGHYERSVPSGKARRHVLQTFRRTAIRKSSWRPAVVFLERAMSWTARTGVRSLSYAQNLAEPDVVYEASRTASSEVTLSALARLGPGAFGTILARSSRRSSRCYSRSEHPGDVAFVPRSRRRDVAGPGAKAQALRDAGMSCIGQQRQLANADHRIVFGTIGDRHVARFRCADSVHGIRTGDSRRFIRQFWELRSADQAWELSSALTDAGRGRAAGMAERSVLGTGTRRFCTRLAKRLPRSSPVTMAWGQPGVACRPDGKPCPAVSTPASSSTTTPP